MVLRSRTARTDAVHRNSSASLRLRTIARKNLLTQKSILSWSPWARPQLDCLHLAAPSRDQNYSHPGSRCQACSEKWRKTHPEPAPLLASCTLERTWSRSRSACSRTRSRVSPSSQFWAHAAKKCRSWNKLKSWKPTLSSARRPGTSIFHPPLPSLPVHFLHLQKEHLSTLIPKGALSLLFSHMCLYPIQ